MPVLHVVIPFYNEGGTIRLILQRVLDAALPADWSLALVVVDDYSTPADRQALDELAATLTSQGHRIRLCGHDRNRGKGAALQTGFDAVLAEAEVPKAIAQSFRDGHLGIMDFYRIKNVLADTAMRQSIAGDDTTDTTTA